MTRWRRRRAVLGLAAATAQPARPRLDSRLSPDERARVLLQQMTPAEKVDLMTGNQGEAPYAFYNAGTYRVHVGSSAWDAPLSATLRVG